MKLVHPDLECQILLDEQRPCEWVIESPDIFLRFVQELYAQINGKEGGFVLSDKEEMLLAKYAEIIVDPLQVNINDRKVLNKLYEKLSDLSSGEELYLETQQILSRLREYFLTLEYASDYCLETDQEINITTLFKALGVKFQDRSDNLVENICQYVSSMASMLSKELIVLVNFRSYVNDEQLELLIKDIQYKEVALLFIEPVERKLLKGVYRYIIDKDQCEIY